MLCHTQLHAGHLAAALMYAGTAFLAVMYAGMLARYTVTCQSRLLFLQHFPGVVASTVQAPWSCAHTLAVGYCLGPCDWRSALGAVGWAACWCRLHGDVLMVSCTKHARKAEASSTAGSHAKLIGYWCCCQTNAHNQHHKEPCDVCYAVLACG